MRCTHFSSAFLDKSNSKTSGACFPSVPAVALSFTGRDHITTLLFRISWRHSTITQCIYGQISPCYIRLRAKSAKAVPGVELEDGEPISSYGVCRGGAIFLLIDPPMPEPKEPAAPGPRAEPESAANRTGEDSVRQCGGAVPDEAPPRGGAQPALPGDSASRQDAGASPGTPSSIDDDWLQSPRKKKRTKAWTEGHILKLVRGVEKHGLGAWAAILRDRELQFPMGATQVTLKDKWRNLVIAVQKGKKMRGVSLSPVVLQKIRDIAEGAG
mmetsp:Transcript_41716/g.98967  ORF Transcript_41716/g.98967 Transcript_41716/m.98967 type:complete len:270 (+) Transcript_41716:498-1307(+)